MRTNHKTGVIAFREKREKEILRNEIGVGLDNSKLAHCLSKTEQMMVNICMRVCNLFAINMQN